MENPHCSCQLTRVRVAVQPDDLFLGVGITAMPLFNGELRTDTAGSTQGQSSAYNNEWQ